MSLHRFFLDEQILGCEAQPEFPLRLRAEDMKHARVLRIQPKEHIAVVDAASDYFECEVVSISEGAMIVRITQHESATEPAWDVTLVQGIAKSDKMDDIVRHVTELGVSRIIPLECSRAVVKLSESKLEKRLQRWESIARSAAMQSGRVTVPAVCAPQSVTGVGTALADVDAVLVCWEEADGAVGVGEALAGAPDDARIAVVVGPEGGLSAQEVDMLLASDHARLISLGPTILRTETAGIVASALAIYAMGGLGNNARYTHR